MPISSEPATPGAVFTIGRAILRPLLWLRYRPRISGAERVPPAGPVLLASNHLSAVDTILIPSFSPRKVQFLAKSALFRRPIGRWFFTRIGAIPVYRDVGSESQSALEAGARVLRAGRVFAVFPEGSRSPDGRLYRGRRGAAYLALETGATVVPVGVIGTNRSDSRSSTGKPVRTEVRFGDPIDLSDLAGLPGGRARSAATERIMAAIQALTGQDVASEYSSGSREA